MLESNIGMKDMDEFGDKVVLITGAGRGAGRETALAFSSLGAIVAANDINPISLDETVSQIQQAGGKAGAYVFDIAKRMPIEGLVAQVLDHFSRIDILVNHASVQPDASLLDMDEWEFHRTLDVNLGGPFFTMQQVGRVMRQQGGGVMVNLLSGLEHGHIQKGYTAFSSSQAGVIGLTRTAAAEFSAYNIRVNSIIRGSIDLGLIPSQDWGATAFHRWLETFPNLRQGDYQNLVSTVLFLCSNAASSLTGQIIRVDSGK
jgi:NAD(P)-dependent dehydrogenase (short-subunit alcohol dehydrogenase family)